MVSGQHRAAQVVETPMACLAQVALPVPLSFVMAVADDHGTVAVRTAHAIRPAMLISNSHFGVLLRNLGRILPEYDRAKPWKPSSQSGLARCGNEISDKFVGIMRIAGC